VERLELGRELTKGMSGHRERWPDILEAQNMDIYTLVSENARTFATANGWPDFQRVVERAVASHPDHWQLAIIACQAAGGARENAEPAAIALAYLHIAIILIDDLLDEDPRGEHLRSSPGAAANLASALQAAGLDCIERSPLEAPVRQAILSCLNTMLLETARGQYLDAQNPTTEEGYWQSARTKSAPFFGAALQAGGLAAGMTLEAAQDFDRIGRLYGEMIQLHDDLADCLAVPAGLDWLTRRMPLPLLYAQTVDHPERERFIALRRQVGDPQALDEAQAILVRCGAVSYAIHHLLLRSRQAAELCARLNPPNPRPLADLLDEVIQPVYALFERLHLGRPELSLV
jgi:geranylgeranyl pyrophosphate synthase